MDINNMSINQLKDKLKKEMVLCECSYKGFNEKQYSWCNNIPKIVNFKKGEYYSYDLHQGNGDEDGSYCNVCDDNGIWWCYYGDYHFALAFPSIGVFDYCEECTVSDLDLIAEEQEEIRQVKLGTIHKAPPTNWDDIRELMDLRKELELLKEIDLKEKNKDKDVKSKKPTTLDLYFEENSPF